MEQLILQIQKRLSDLEWEWQLLGEGGNICATHQVSLDPNDPQWQAAERLEQFLNMRRIPWRDIESEAEQLDRLGDWLAETLFGSIATYLDGKTAELVIRLEHESLSILNLPIELTHIGGMPIWKSGICTRYEIQSQPEMLTDIPSNHEGPNAEIRMLAIFSMPQDVSVLSLRKERLALTRVVEQARSTGRAVMLKPFQYFGSEQQLAKVLSDPDSWDVIHISSHGVPGGLILQDQNGISTYVGVRRLAKVLRNCRGRLRLVTLLSCNSASVPTEYREYAETPSSVSLSQDSPVQSAQALAAFLARELSCTVIGMRYSVRDSEAIDLSVGFYKSFLSANVPICLALRNAVTELARRSAIPGTLAMTTPIILSPLGSFNEPLCPVLSNESFGVNISTNNLPQAPRYLIGRALQLTKIIQTLQHESDFVAAVLVGMPGVGKTACMIEVAHLVADDFSDMIWVDLRDQYTRSQVANGLLAAPSADSPDSRSATTRRLYIIDGLETILSPSGEWLDSTCAAALTEKIKAANIDRIVMITRYEPTPRLPKTTRVVFVPMSREESRLLAFEMLADAEDPQPSEIAIGLAGTKSSYAEFVDSYLVRPAAGNPALISLSVPKWSILKQSLLPRLIPGGCWWDPASDLDMVADAMRSIDDRYEHLLNEIRSWADDIASRLDDAERAIFASIGYLAESDRFFATMAGIPQILRQHRLAVTNAAIQGVLETLVPTGLISLGNLTISLTTGERSELPVGPDELRSVIIHPAITSHVALWLALDVRNDIDISLANMHEALLSSYSSNQNPAAQVMELSAITYRVRCEHWSNALLLISSYAQRDNTWIGQQQMTAAVSTVIELAKDTKVLKFARQLRDWIRAKDPTGWDILLRAELKIAESRADYSRCEQLLGSLNQVLVAQARYSEVSINALRRAQYCEMANLGPWTRIDARIDQLYCIAADHSNGTVFSDLEECIDQIESLSRAATANMSQIVESVRPSHVRRRIFELALNVTKKQEKYEKALYFNQLLEQEQIDQSAGTLELAMRKVEEAQILAADGRAANAISVISQYRDHLTKQGQNEAISMLLVTQANIESSMGRYSEALDIQRDVFDLMYSLRSAGLIASAHHNYANYMFGAKRPLKDIMAHRLICCLIRVGTDPGKFGNALFRLYSDFEGSLVNMAVPSFDELVGSVEAQVDVEIRRFLNTTIWFSADHMLSEIVELAIREERKMAEVVSEELVRYVDLTRRVSKSARGEIDRLQKERLLSTIRAMIKNGSVERSLGDELLRIATGDVTDCPEGLDPLQSMIVQLAIDGARAGHVGSIENYVWQAIRNLESMQSRAITAEGAIWLEKESVSMTQELLRRVSAVEGATSGLDDSTTVSKDGRIEEEEEEDTSGSISDRRISGPLRAINEASRMIDDASELVVDGEVNSAESLLERAYISLREVLGLLLRRIEAGESPGLPVAEARIICKELLRLVDVAQSGKLSRLLAKQALEISLGLMRDLEEPEHPNISSVIRHLVMICEDSNELQEARQYLETLIGIESAYHSTTDKVVMDLYARCGSLLTALGDYGAAQEYALLAVRNARSSVDGTLGLSRIDLARYLYGLGSAYRLAGDKRRARETLIEAESIQLEYVEETWEELAKTLNLLGLLAVDENNFQLGSSYYVQALRILESKGKDETAKAQEVLIEGNLAMALLFLGDADAALRMQEQVLSAKRNMFAEDSIEIPITIGNIGLIKKTMKDYDGAVRAQLEALTLLKRWHGNENHHTLRTGFNLATALRELGDNQQETEVLEWIARLPPTGGAGDQYINAARWYLRKRSAASERRRWVKLRRKK